MLQRLPGSDLGYVSYPLARYWRGIPGWCVMAMLAKLAAPIYPGSESRRYELEAMKVPREIVNLCSRPNVWRTANSYDPEIPIFKSGKDLDRCVFQEDLIEFIPGKS